jgi:5-methylcytosine-specific restriction endonuclease McrA
VCRPCYERAYESRNSARRRELRDARRDQIRERSRIRAREYRAAHPEKVRLAQEKYRKRNPERVREAQKRYWTSDRGVLVRRQKVSRRKAAPGSPRVDYAAILEQHGMFCHICSMVIVDKSDLHFDHVIPLALGGPHSADNIRPSHAICNLRKGARVA